MTRPALARFAVPRRKVRVRRQLQPDAVRLFYFSALRALMSKAHALVTAELLPLLHEIVPDAKADAAGPRLVRADAEAEEQVRAKVRELAKVFGRNITPNKLRPLAEKVAERTSEFQKAQLSAQLKDAIGVSPLLRDEGLAAAADAFTVENVALIKTVPERYFGEIEQVVVDGVNGGQRATTIAKDIEARFEVSTTNAARIANDSVGKFFGDLNRVRQQELGITRYTWVTAHDNRVRDTHRGLDGQVFEWADPPMGGGTDEAEAGNPGFGINCRCQGLPDVEGFLDAL